MTGKVTAFHEMGGYGMARDLAPAKRHSSIVLHDAPLRFSLYPIPVSKSHLIRRNVHVNRRKLCRVF